MLATDINVLTSEISVDTNTFEVTGSGIFDILMTTATKHIKAQFDSGKITGSEYATVYLGMFQSVLATATQIFLQKDLLDAQAASEASKKLLIDRQTLGFDDNERSKIIKLILDAYSVYFTVIKPSTKPDFLTDETINDIVEKVFNGIGKTVTDFDFDTITNQI